MILSGRYSVVIRVEFSLPTWQQDAGQQDELHPGDDDAALQTYAAEIYTGSHLDAWLPAIHRSSPAENSPATRAEIPRSFIPVIASGLLRQLAALTTLLLIVLQPLGIDAATRSRLVA